MSDGFKKYFNSSTMQGRANVAKVTYATFAVMYLIYRVRRKSGKKPTNDGELLAKEPSCTCDRERDPIDPCAGLYDADPECAVCRERSERAMTEFDKEEQRRSAQAQEEEENCNGYSNPPPKPPPQSPPPSGGGSTMSPPRRKCPCDAPHNRGSVGPVKTSQTRGQFQQSQRPYVPLPVPSEIQETQPVSELIGQVNDAVYQAVRSVVAAVINGAAQITNNNSNQTPREDCNCNSIKNQNTTKNFEAAEPNHQSTQQTDDEREEEVLLPRRTAPRSCVPADFENQEEMSQTDTESAKRSDSQPLKEQYNHSFSDGFAAEMYFENIEE